MGSPQNDAPSAAQWRRTLDALRVYYRHTRGVGHTTLMQVGLDQTITNFAIMANSHTMAKQIAQSSCRSGVHVEEISVMAAPGQIERQLRSCSASRLPMAIDNSAMMFLLDMTVAALDDRAREIASLNEENCGLRRELGTLRIAYLEVNHTSALRVEKLNLAEAAVYRLRDDLERAQRNLAETPLRRIAWTRLKQRMRKLVSPGR